MAEIGFIDKEGLKDYLKDNLKLQVQYTVGFGKKIQLVFGDEVISSVEFMF